MNSIKSEAEPSVSGAAASSASSNSTKNILIVCVAAIICVAIVAGGFIYLNSNNGTSDSSSAVVDSNQTTVLEDNGSDDDSNSSASSSVSSASSVDEMTFAEAKSYLSGASNTVIRNTFDEADANGDGVLTGDEISRFKYLADLTDRTADTSNTDHVEAQDYGAGDGTTKTRYCTTHGRVAVGSDNRCPYCEAEGLDSRTVKGSTEYV